MLNVRKVENVNLKLYTGITELHTGLHQEQIVQAVSESRYKYNHGLSTSFRCLVSSIKRKALTTNCVMTEFIK